MGIGSIRRSTAYLRAHWTRGAPGRPTPPPLVTGLYALWLVALALKSLGSAWDISWHFRSLRDNAFIPPHDLNLVGELLVLTLLVWHSYTGYGMDRAALRIAQSGMGLFVLAAPLDELNHRINGLDITTWSPSHFLLFAGTGILVAGVVRGLGQSLHSGRFRTVGLLLGCAFFFDNTMFPNEHQEYGTLALLDWDRGRSLARPDLLAFAARQIGHPVDRAAVLHFALPMPDWVYPVFGVLAATAVLLVAHRVVRLPGTALAIVAGYLGYRTVLWVVLDATGFPRSTVPYWLLAVAVAVDLAVALPVGAVLRAVAGAALVTAFGYVALTVQGMALLAPPFAPWSAPVTGLALAVLWLLAETWWPPRYRRLVGRLDAPRSAAAGPGERAVRRARGAARLPTGPSRAAWQDWWRG